MDFSFSEDFKCRMLLHLFVFYQLVSSKYPQTDRQESGSVVIDRLDGPDPCLDKPLSSPMGIVSQQESQTGILVNVSPSLS